MFRRSQSAQCCSSDESLIGVQNNHALEDLKNGALELILLGHALKPIRRCLISTSSSTAVSVCEYDCVRVRDAMCAGFIKGVYGKACHVFWVQEWALCFGLRACTIHLRGPADSLCDIHACFVSS